PFLPGPQDGELIGGGQVAVAVMENVGDGEVVIERGQHKHDARQQHGGESCDSGAAGGFTETSRSGILTEQCNQACQERVRTQAERQHQRKASYLRHQGNPKVSLCIFSEKWVLCKPRETRELFACELRLPGQPRAAVPTRATSPADSPVRANRGCRRPWK